MSHFNLKSLSFYGIAISSVVTLFAIVTAYGEGNLSASMPISGNYSFQLPLLKGCSARNTVNLSIQQSGIYIAAALTSEQAIKVNDKLSASAMTLNGQWQNKQLTLDGVVPHRVFCATSQKYSQNFLVKTNIQGSFHQSILTGKILLNSTDSIPFTAERHVQAKTEQTSH